MEKILVAKIIKAHSLHGAVKVLPFIDDLNDLVKIKNVFIEDNPATVQKVSVYKDYGFVKFTTINDRNQAESMIGQSVYAYKDDVELPEGRYFIDDIIGCCVEFEDGEYLGRVFEIKTNPRIADVYVVDMGQGKTCQFPFLNKLIGRIDISQETIVIKKEIFEQVVVFD